MLNITRLLPKFLDATGSNPEMMEVAAKIAWARAAGDGLRRQAIPFRLYRKTLIVSVADAIWQKQLQTMSAELVFRVNQLLGRNIVDFIEFRVDPATVNQTRASALSPRQRPRSEPRQPIPTELISAAASITDRDLRHRFIRAAENCIARREARQL